MFGRPDDYPYVATTYRLTEHFHYWSKHCRINAILQPEQFVEIGDALAREKGIVTRERIEVRSNHGRIKVPFQSSTIGLTSGCAGKPA